jgi:hypothetical protein
LLGKLLYEELTKSEKEIFYRIPRIFDDPIINGIIRFLNNKGKKRELGAKIEILNHYGYSYPERKDYLSIKNSVSFFFFEEERQLSRVKPYSGYTKHYKDHGSLAPERSEIISVSFDDGYLFDEENLFDFFFHLSQSILPIFVKVRLTLAEDANKQKQRSLLLNLIQRIYDYQE